MSQVLGLQNIEMRGCVELPLIFFLKYTATHEPHESYDERELDSEQWQWMNTGQCSGFPSYPRCSHRGKTLDDTRQTCTECMVIMINHTSHIKGNNSPLTWGFNPRPTGGGYFEPPSRFLAISSKPMQVSPPNLQYPVSQHIYTLC